jgi:hypothetical protein
MGIVGLITVDERSIQPTYLIGNEIPHGRTTAPARVTHPLGWITHRASAQADI